MPLPAPANPHAPPAANTHAAGHGRQRTGVAGGRHQCPCLPLLTHMLLLLLLTHVQLGTGDNAQAVLEAATSARDQVAQALGLKQGRSSAGGADGGFGDGDKLARLLELLQKQQNGGK